MSGDGYDSDRNGFTNNERGRIWEYGTDRFYRDRENGYVKPPQSREHWTPEGYRRYDKENVNEKGQIRAVEDKSGSITGENDRRELEKDYFLLDRGLIDHLLLRTVAGEAVSKECRDLIDKLQRDFPAKFTHLEISRSEAREIWSKGLAVERGKGQQLEISGVREKAREAKAKALENRREQIAEIAKARERKERARERLENIRKIEQTRAEKERMAIAAEQAAAAERIAREERETRQHEQDRDRELAKTAEAREQIKVMNAELAQGIEEQAREINSAWDKGEAVAVENVREAHTDLSQSLEAIREAELAQTRNDFLASGHTQEEVQAIEPRLEQIREDNRYEIVQGINTLGAIVERGDETRDRADREAAERQRDQERAAQREAARAQDAARQAAYERLQQQGRLTEAERIQWLSQATDPHAAVRERPGTAPQVRGHGRESGDSRGITRDR
ncbi:hypothetical protein [Nocardia brasiliensis]|uniref:hypothetical protein n=1 Tax=Nocardia brasiliensis TaxID=37326 RepID=UPI001892EAA6|nr:hypothetical protein [Nocardia brasiliensis]MBF6131141.1 hypothetical protein [Nocardia brasiliensis]